jgi:hypothetical protein
MVNNSKNEWIAFVIGIICGAGILTVLAINGGYLEEVHKLKDACESELSRDLICEMRFVAPEEI